MDKPRALVLYDGECRFCRACARWAARRDRRQQLALLPFQECSSPPMTADLRRACERSLHVITADGGTERAGRAVLVILVSLGWPVGRAARRPLVWGVEAAYWLVARNRSRLSRFVSS